MIRDNVCILKLKNLYKVAYIPNVQNLFWSFESFSVESRFSPIRLLEYYLNAEGGVFYKDIIGTALFLQRKTKSKIKILYYGNTWEGLVKEAREVAVREIANIQNNYNIKWDNDLNKLLKIKEETWNQDALSHR